MHRENSRKISVSRQRWIEIFDFLMENGKTIPELLCTVLDQDMVRAEVRLLNVAHGDLALFPLHVKHPFSNSCTVLGTYRPSPYNPFMLADSIMRTSIIDIVAGVVNQVEVRGGV